MSIQEVGPIDCACQYSSTFRCEHMQIRGEILEDSRAELGGIDSKMHWCLYKYEIV